MQLYNWGNYASPDLMKKIEDETGIKVTVTDYDGNDDALAKVEAGGHGYDLVAPSANYIPIWREKRLIVALADSKLPNKGNIAPAWKDLPWNPMRAHSVPWQWGSIGVAVHTATYGGDINISDIFLRVPEELKGKINVLPEMNDGVNMAIFNLDSAACTEDTEVLKKTVIFASRQSRRALFQRECRRGGIHAGQYEDRAGNGNT